MGNVLHQPNETRSLRSGITLLPGTLDRFDRFKVDKKATPGRFTRLPPTIEETIRTQIEVPEKMPAVPRPPRHPEVGRRGEDGAK